MLTTNSPGVSIAGTVSVFPTPGTVLLFFGVNTEPPWFSPTALILDLPLVAIVVATLAAAFLLPKLLAPCPVPNKNGCACEALVCSDINTLYELVKFLIATSALFAEPT